MNDHQDSICAVSKSIRNGHFNKENVRRNLLLGKSACHIIRNFLDIAYSFKVNIQKIALQQGSLLQHYRDRLITPTQP